VASGDYVVRTAEPGDLGGVARLHGAGPSDRQRAAWRDMLAAPGLTVYIAEHGGEVVGTVSVQVMPNLGYDAHPSALVEAMVVAPAHRRRGVGRRLMDRALADLRAASCRKVQLLSHKRHAGDGAYDFYRGLGFTTEAEGFRLYLEEP
jgi:ribosomal protein S18 acetylase RimI-like enzyme